LTLAATEWGSRFLTQFDPRTGTPAISREQPLLLTRRSATHAPEREILCIGIDTEMLRASGLPQRVGILQSAQLCLPILARQLRARVHSFCIVDADTGAAHIEPSDSDVVDLYKFAPPLDDRILTILSPQWRDLTADRDPNYRTVAKFAPTSAFYRLAVFSYKVILAGGARQALASVFDTEDGYKSLNLGFAKLEHRFEGILVKFRSPHGSGRSPTAQPQD
jgi:hypothetical protein